MERTFAVGLDVRRISVASIVVLALALGACDGGGGGVDAGPSMDGGGNVQGIRDAGAPRLETILSEDLRLPESDPAFESVEVSDTELVYQFNGEPSVEIAPNLYVAGEGGPGYLRRVIRVSRSGNTWSVLAAPAYLDEVVEQGEIIIDVDDAPPSGGFPLLASIPLEQQLVGSPGAGVRLEGEILAELDLRVRVTIERFEVTGAEIVLLPRFRQEVGIVAESSASLSSTGSVDLDRSSPPIPFRFLLGALPVVGEIQTGFVVGYDFSASAGLSMTARFPSEIRGELGIRYAEGAWEPVQALTVDDSPPTVTAAAEPPSAGLYAYVQPDVRVVFYGLGGPSFFIRRGPDLLVGPRGGCAAWWIEDRRSHGVQPSVMFSLPFGLTESDFAWQSEERRDELASGAFGDCCPAQAGEACCEGTTDRCSTSGVHACGADGVCRSASPGGPCTADDECAGDLRCGAAGTCVVGTSGDPCAGPDDCQMGFGCATGRCRDERDVYPCTSDTDCLGESVCALGLCRRPANGLPCEEAADCPSLSLCASHGICQRGDVGDPCSVPGDCADRLGLTLLCAAHGRCQEGEAGDPCASVLDCRAGLYCGGGHCHSGSASSCTDDTDCFGGMICNARGYCARMTVGAPCDDGDVCLDESYWRCGPDGFCGGGEGQVCATDLDCNTTLHPGVVCTAAGYCGPSTYCRTSADCGGSSRCGPYGFCQTGQRGSPCTDDTQCAIDHLCGPEGFCQRGVVGDPCRVDAGDCFSSPSLRCSPLGICQRGARGDPCDDPTDCNFDLRVVCDEELGACVPGGA